MNKKCTRGLTNFWNNIKLSILKLSKVFHYKNRIWLGCFMIVRPCLSVLVFLCKESLAIQHCRSYHGIVVHPFLTFFETSQGIVKDTLFGFNLWPYLIKTWPRPSVNQRLGMTLVDISYRLKFILTSKVVLWCVKCILGDYAVIPKYNSLIACPL